MILNFLDPFPRIEVIKGFDFIQIQGGVLSILILLELFALYLFRTPYTFQVSPVTMNPKPHGELSGYSRPDAAVFFCVESILYALNTSCSASSPLSQLLHQWFSKTIYLLYLETWHRVTFKDLNSESSNILKLEISWVSRWTSYAVSSLKVMSHLWQRNALEWLVANCAIFFWQCFWITISISLCSKLLELR